MTQLTKNPSFESINVGDELPPFEIGETQETMDAPSEHSRMPHKCIHESPKLKV